MKVENLNYINIDEMKLKGKKNNETQSHHIYIGYII